MSVSTRVERGRQRLSQMSENAKRIFQERYCLPEETIEDAIWRVAKHIGSKRGEEWVEKYFEHIATFTGVPNSPTFTGAGTRLGQLSACFTLDIQDNIESIMQTLKDAVLIQKSGGGLGFNFSNIRPKGAYIGSTGKNSPGVCSWLKMYDDVFGNILQAASRSGANMGILRCDHPDIFDFIQIKNSERSITNFNISILFDANFMHALETGSNIELWWTNAAGKRVVERSLPAQEIWDAFIEHTHRMSEPSALFEDNINKNNPLEKVYGRYRVTNPCAEIPMKEYESCNLSCIALDNFADWETGFDWEAYKDAIRVNTYLLNDIVNVNELPIEQIQEMNRRYRRIGNGLTGIHDAMIKLGIAYGTPESFDFLEKATAYLRFYAMQTSMEIAWEDKVVFDNFDESIYAQGLENYDLDFEKYIDPEEVSILSHKIYDIGLANTHFTMLAPTGTRSSVADKGGYGIEPIFAYVYTRWVTYNDGSGERYPIYIIPKVFDEYLERYKADFVKEDILKAIENNEGSVQGLDKFFTPEEQLILTDANALTPQQHVDMLAHAQVYLDQAISKTINCPADTSVEELHNIFFSAWEKGCKGLTIYRNRSREKVVIETKKIEEAILDILVEEAQEQGEYELDDYSTMVCNLVDGTCVSCA